MKTYVVVLICLIFLPVSFALEGFSSPQADVSLSDSLVVSDSVVYSQGYVSDDGQNWEQFSFTGRTRGNWIIGTAASEVRTDANYYAIYSCTWRSGWSCSDNWNVFTTSSNHEVVGSIQGDHEALMKLFSETGGIDWWENTGWVGSTPETMSEMYGVSVDSDGRVVGIDLLRNNLVGRLDAIPWQQLDRLEYLNLKQPLTQEEYYASNPVSQVSTNPPDKLSGPIPASIGSLSNLRWLSLGGQYDEILRGDVDPSWNEGNHGSGHSDPGKRYVQGNRFSGVLPKQLGNLSKLEVLEIRRQELTGPIPTELGELSNLVSLFLNGLHGDSVTGLTGPIPVELTQLSNLTDLHLNSNKLTGVVPPEINELTELRNIRIGGNDFDSHELPALDQLDKLRVFMIGRANVVGRFPSELFLDGRNPYLDKFVVARNDLDGSEFSNELPLEEYSYLDDFSVGQNNMQVPLPEWVAELSLQLFNFDHNQFSGSLPQRFYDHDAPMYTKTRSLRFNSNQFTGELPDVPVARVEFSGTVISSDAQSVVTDIDLDILESGTISVSSSGWIQDADKQWGFDEWEDSYVVAIAVPDQEDISFVPWQSRSRYLYSPSSVDTQGTEGYAYSISPLVESRVIRFQTGPNEYVARIIDSFDSSGTINLDKPLGVDVSGLPVSIHGSSGLLLMAFNRNSFTGSIPQSYAYIPTDRDLQIGLYHNELSGVVPDFSTVGRDGGFLESLRIYGNRFSPDDIALHFESNNAVTERFEYTPQKPFGIQNVYRVDTGDSVVIDDFSMLSHPNNSYRWVLEDVVVQESGPVLELSDITAADSGVYVLEVSNSLTGSYVFESQPITVIVD